MAYFQYRGGASHIPCPVATWGQVHGLLPLPTWALWSFMQCSTDVWKFYNAFTDFFSSLEGTTMEQRQHHWPGYLSSSDNGSTASGQSQCNMVPSTPSKVVQKNTMTDSNKSCREMQQNEQGCTSPVQFPARVPRVTKAVLVLSPNRNLSCYYPLKYLVQKR